MNADNPAAIQNVVLQRDDLQNGLLSTCREVSRATAVSTTFFPAKLNEVWNDYVHIPNCIGFADFFFLTASQQKFSCLLLDCVLVRGGWKVIFSLHSSSGLSLIFYFKQKQLQDCHSLSIGGLLHLKELSNYALPKDFKKRGIGRDIAVYCLFLPCDGFYAEMTSNHFCLCTDISKKVSDSRE